MNKTLCLVASAAALVPCLALADATTDGVAHAVYTWTCANPDIVEPLLEWAFGGLVTLMGLNATLKKLGFTKDSPAIGWLVWGLRKLVADVKPPPSVIVAQAATVIATSPDIVKATGVDPTKVAAAADALKKGT